MSAPGLWEMDFLLPARILAEACKTGNGDVQAGLKILAARGDGWVSRLAEYLLYNREARSRAAVVFRGCGEP